MRMLRSLAAALIGLTLAACATTPANTHEPWRAAIVQPGDIYSDMGWAPEMETALLEAGRAAEIEAIKAHYSEPGWPSKFADIDERLQAPQIIKLYRAETIAMFQFQGNDVVLLRIPAASNKHMPEGWRPTEDIYIPIRAGAVKRVS